LTRYNEYGIRIEQQIKATSHPIAIKMLTAEDEIPPEAKRPIKDYGACLATCQVFSLTRNYGETVAQLFEDMWCPEPVIGYGLAAPPHYFLEGHNRYPDGVASLEAGGTWAREYPRFAVGTYIGVLSAPLRTASFEPDVALFYCNSAQLLRLLLGIAYHDGKDLPVTLGGHAACVYGVVPPIQKQQCWVAVPCRGDRGRAGTQDHELIFAVPKDQIGRLAHGLEQPGTGSTPTGFSMTPEYKLSESYAEMARQMGMKRADGSRIEGYTAAERRLDLQYRQTRSDTPSTR
jgi:uncharacterized protein (DUF169 family)